MTFLLPFHSLLYTVPIIANVLPEMPVPRGWLWYYSVFLLGCGVVWVVRRLWR